MLPMEMRGRQELGAEPGLRRLDPSVLWLLQERDHRGESAIRLRHMGPQHSVCSEARVHHALSFLKCAAAWCCSVFPPKGGIEPVNQAYVPSD